MMFAAPQTQRKAGVSNSSSVLCSYLRWSDKQRICLHPNLSLPKRVERFPWECGWSSSARFIRGRQQEFLKGPLIFTAMSRSTSSPVVFNLHQAGTEWLLCRDVQGSAVLLLMGRKTLYVHEAAGVSSRKH